MSIRPAGPSDIAGMHRVRLSVQENRLVRTVLTELDYLQHLTVIGQGWVAEIDGTIRGFAIANRENGSIWALFVEPGYEGRGVGRALQATMLEWMQAAGCTRAWLETEAGTRAEQFYRRSGWRYAGPGASGDMRFERDLSISPAS